MAIHEIPDLRVKALAEYINTDTLGASARNAAELLTLFPELRVWKVQYKAPAYRNNAWYVGLADCEEPYLFNVTLTPPNLKVEFRFTHYLPTDILDKLQWQNSSWAYASYKLHGQATVAGMMRAYLAAVRPDHRAGKLKTGGKSSAEMLIRRLLEYLFPDQIIWPNKRLDELRSAKGRPLEFDLWVPDLRLAIEVQGPQHFGAVWGENAALVANDRLKREWCADQGIKLAWLNWDGVTRDLLRLPVEEQRRHLGGVLTRFLKGKETFLWWKCVDTQEFM